MHIIPDAVHTNLYDNKSVIPFDKIEAFYEKYLKYRFVMSLLIHIFYTGRNEAAQQFAEEMLESGTVDRIRAEKGNLRYGYFFPEGNPETVLLIDEWRDQACAGRPPQKRNDENHCATSGKI